MSSSMVPLQVRRGARRLGVGRALLKVHALRALTLRGAIEVFRARTRDLPRILSASPLAAHDGRVEIHMLLHHQRILEGVWALYSFAFFAGEPCQVFVHSDGSLTSADVALLQRVLPGAHVISREAADERVESRLGQRGLSQSLRFRNSLIFALKLIDPFFFGRHPTFFLLDSDVLFFQRPEELLNDFTGSDGIEPPNLYSPDNGTRYCLAPDTLRNLLGRECVPFFNPGVVRANRSVLDLARIESYLHRPEFWSSESRPHYYGELTLWAMQLTTSGAHRLPPSYAITPPLEGPLPTSGHFCGGGYPATWFYTRAIPHLARQFGI
jgi:hypothetical protein